MSARSASSGSSPYAVASAALFLARVLTHIPDTRQGTPRDYGWYANRPRGMRRHQAEPADATAPGIRSARATARAHRARRRWAELVRQIVEVDPLACPRCGTLMRLISFMAARAGINHILTHLRSMPGTSWRTW